MHMGFVVYHMHAEHNVGLVMTLVWLDCSRSNYTVVDSSGHGLS
jgi:hypothetical protein